LPIFVRVHRPRLQQAQIQSESLPSRTVERPVLLPAIHHSQFGGIILPDTVGYEEASVQFELKRVTQSFAVVASVVLMAWLASAQQVRGPVVTLDALINA